MQWKNARKFKSLGARVEVVGWSGWHRDRRRDHQNVGGHAGRANAAQKSLANYCDSRVVANTQQKSPGTKCAGFA